MAARSPGVETVQNLGENRVGISASSRCPRSPLRSFGLADEINGGRTPRVLDGLSSGQWTLYPLPAG